MCICTKSLQMCTLTGHCSLGSASSRCQRQLASQRLTAALLSKCGTKPVPQHVLLALFSMPDEPRHTYNSCPRKEEEVCLLGGARSEGALPALLCMSHVERLAADMLHVEVMMECPERAAKPHGDEADGQETEDWSQTEK